MTTSAIYHIQGIKKFKHVSTKYKNGNCHQKIEISKHSCPKCGSPEVSPYVVRERIIRGQNLGRKKVFSHVQIHRLYCKKCQVTCYENFDLLPHPKSRITNSLARTIIDLRREMTVNAIAKHFGLDWDTVKEVEVKWLKKKYRRIRMKDVKIIGMDEIHVGHEWKDGKRRQKYLTVVRDMCAGAVLFVGNGKGSEALAPFNARINSFKGNIEAVCMDMSNAYAKWVKEQLPNATVVYDHFHVIQLMNRRLDEIRRRIQAELDSEATKQLKGKRWLLHKSDNLAENERLEIEALQHISKDLYDAWTLKECLIKIYQLADDTDDARQMLMYWAGICNRMNARELRTMDKTILKHLEGVCAYWKFDRLTNAASEGFNNKIRHLIAQAYGYRDYKYLKLKIYELPSMKLSKQLHSS